MKKTLALLISIMFFFAGASLVFGGSSQEAEESTGSTGAAMAASDYSESPMLADMVKAGSLPSIEDRLPNEPLVLVPNESIGKYGGTIRLTTMGAPSNYVINTYWLLETPIMRTQSVDDLYANVLAGYEESADYKVFTFYMREGLKWSDGTPVTIEIGRASCRERV